jgi:F-type H+-transporting ATPase subunit a
VSLVTDTAGASDPAITEIATALFGFIAGSACIGQLPGVRAPTANLAATAALALVVFVSVPALGILRAGPRGYLREYVQPTPLFLPIHVVSEVSRTVALALRLFGNMMSGHLVVALLVTLAGVLVPVPLMALDLLIGLLQAYIFTILTCVYLGAARRSEVSL